MSILGELREEIAQEEKRDRERLAAQIAPPALPPDISSETVDYSMEIDESCIDPLANQVERVSLNDKIRQYGAARRLSENVFRSPPEEVPEDFTKIKRQTVKLESSPVHPLPPIDTPIAPVTPVPFIPEESFAQGLSLIVGREPPTRPMSANPPESMIQGSILLRTVELNTAPTPEERGEVLALMLQRQNQLTAMGVFKKLTIELPDCPIVVKESILIRTPVYFRGRPGTTLQIESSILIDIDPHFSDAILPNQDITTATEFAVRPLVQFSECVIKFTRDAASDEEALASLFVINRGSKLFMRDCQLKTSVWQTYINTSRAQYREVSDVCFQLVGHNHSAVSTAVSSQLCRLDRGETSLHVVSCTMDGFTHFVLGAEDASIQIELSSLSSARGNALELKNPQRLFIQRSIIEKAMGHGVYVKLEQVHDTKLERQIILDAAIIMGNVGCGVIVTGTQAPSAPPSAPLEQKIGASLSKPTPPQAAPFIRLLEIKKTRIYHCKKDGILIRNVSLHHQNGVIRLDSNQLQNNKDNNIWLAHIQRPCQALPISAFDDPQHANICAFVLHSRIYDAETGYGVYSLDCNVEVEDSEILGNTSGGLMVVGGGSSPLSRVIQSTIKSNKESGIIISEHRGLTEIARCEVSDNSKSGVVATQRLEGPEGSRSTQESHHTEETKSTKMNAADTLREVHRTGAALKIEICDISYNGDHGIQMRNVEVSIKESRIQNNSNNAVALDESSKLLLKLVDYSAAQRRLIVGLIGGMWGSMTASSLGVCEITPGSGNGGYFYQAVEGPSAPIIDRSKDEGEKNKRSAKRTCGCFPSHTTSAVNRGGATSETALSQGVVAKNSAYL